MSTDEITPVPFPRQGSMFHSMIFIEKSRKRYLRFFKISNFFVIPLYKLRLLPLLGLGRRLLILSTTGRKSGKKRNNPLEYFRINNSIHIFAGYGDKADWYRNMVANPDQVYVQAGFRKFQANFEVLKGSELDEAYRWLAREHAGYLKSGFGWDPKIDDPETADFSPLFNLMHVIRITPSQNS